MPLPLGCRGPSIPQRWKLKRIVKPGAKPRFHETAVSDVTQFHCVKRKFSKLLGFGIAVSRNWKLTAWNWICCGFIYRSRLHQENHLRLRLNYEISLTIYVTSDGENVMYMLLETLVCFICRSIWIKITKYKTNTLVTPTPAFEECCVDLPLGHPLNKIKNLFKYLCRYMLHISPIEGEGEIITDSVPIREGCNYLLPNWLRTTCICCLSPEKDHRSGA